jgi:hypothetical protein
MRYLNFGSKISRHILFLILSISYLNSHGTSKVIIKTNIIRGESFVTAKTSAKEVEDVVTEIFSKKGFKVVNEVKSLDDILFVDIFVYQFISQYPAVTMIIRSRNGVHYIGQEYTKVFVDRNSVNIKLATELAEKAPLRIDINSVYQIRIENILSTNRTNPNSFANDIIYKSSRSGYYSMMKWDDSNKIPFIVPTEFELFLFYTSNYTGLKKHLKDGPITLRLKINNSARLELIAIESNSTIEEEHRARIQDFVDSFPLWTTDTPVDNIEILYGIR